MFVRYFSKENIKKVTVMIQLLLLLGFFCKMQSMQNWFQFYLYEAKYLLISSFNPSSHCKKLWHKGSGHLPFFDKRKTFNPLVPGIY